MFPAVRKEDLEARGAMLPVRIEEAFDKYLNCMISGSGQQLLQFLKRCMTVNPEGSYADFYYPCLSEKEKARFTEGLSSEEKQLLAGFDTVSGALYFPLTEENVGFLHRITAEEWLFSSFYFTVHKALIWGNYKRKYPLFCETEKELAFYKNIALECGLEIQE